jgi:beta-lactamase regulating signal transducer with metallopeptidase domain
MDHLLKIVLSLISIVLVVLSIRDILKRKFKNLAFGLVWLFIILVVPIIGPIMYLSLRKGMSAGRPKTFNPVFHKLSGQNYLE